MGEEKWKVTRHILLSIILSSKKRRKDLGIKRGRIGRGFHFEMEKYPCFHGKYNPSLFLLFEHWGNISLIPKFLALFVLFIIPVILLGVAHQSGIQVHSVVLGITMETSEI